MNLLIVNDEVIAAKGLQSGIDWSKYGIKAVDVAFESISAKKLLNEKPYDILLCDIEMPGESGIELVRWVREQKLEVEVIFLTCHADFEFAQEAIRLRCKNYILVPADYEVVAQNVYEVVLSIRKSREERRQQQYGQLWIAEKEKEHEEMEQSNSPEQLVQKVEEYILKYLNNPEMSVNQIAAQMYLNPDYLNRVFKRSKGVSIGRFILEQRMEMAADMLKKKKMGATKVAELVGYNTYSAFVAAFKNYHGCSPSKYE